MRRGRSAALLTAAALSAGCGERSVVVRDERGDELVRAELPSSGRFALEYRHSYYRAPAREWFADAGDGFRMVEVASPSEAVLDYYALAGPKRRGVWMRLAPARPQRFERLPLIAPARHRLGLRRRHHGHARQRHLADPPARRLPARRGRRRPGGLGHRRAAVAADARRGRIHHRRVPPGVLSDGPAVRGSRRSSTTSGSCSRSRPRPAASAPSRSRSRRRRRAGCCCATATTSPRCSRS
jgi:hypothetical protein